MLRLGEPLPCSPFVRPPPDALIRSASMPLPTSVKSAAGPVKKVKWTGREDQTLVLSVQKYGTSSWPLVAGEIPGRTGKQCRERWINQLDPNLNREKWTQQEDAVLLLQQKSCGHCWSKMIQFLPHRSANAIKNRWCWLTRQRADTRQRPAEPAADDSSAGREEAGERVDIFAPRMAEQRELPEQRQALAMEFDPFVWE
jgi:hypothetical protein